MIIFGLSMREKADEVPLEVLVWLDERNKKYPDISFVVDYSARPASHSDEEPRYPHRMYKRRGISGVSHISFVYRNESWHVRIVGLSTPDGRIAPIDATGNDLKALSLTQRNEISGIPDGVEIIHSEDGCVILGIPLKPGESLPDTPPLFPFTPDDRM